MKIFGKELLFNNNKVYHTGSKPTPSEIGAAASSHTHNYAGSSSAGGAATSALACTGNSATATKATQDSAGQQINTTYIKGLSVSGRTITYTKGNGTTGTITTQDTNTTYSTGTSSALGLTKLYTGTGTATDGTMTQAAINTALSGKAASSHTHSSLTGTTGTTIAPSTGTGVMRYDYSISSTNAGTLPVTNNANGLLTFNTHSGSYYSQLGFSSNGSLYYRNFNGTALNTTTEWKKILTSSEIANNQNGFYDKVVYTNTDGVTEIGRHIDFHITNDKSKDFDARIYLDNEDDAVIIRTTHAMQIGGYNDNYIQIGVSNHSAYLKNSNTNHFLGLGNDGILEYTNNCMKIGTTNSRFMQIGTTDTGTYIKNNASGHFFTMLNTGDYSFTGGDLHINGNIFNNRVTTGDKKIISCEPDRLILGNVSTNMYIRGKNTPKVVTNGGSGPIAYVKNDGVMEVGKYMDWHQVGSETDFDGRMILTSKEHWSFGERNDGALSLGTLYSINPVYVTSDRACKKNINYIRMKENVSKNNVNDNNSILTLKNMYDFIKDELVLATYNMNTTNIEDTMINFVAQDLLYDNENNDSKVGQLIVNPKNAVKDDTVLKYNTGNYISVIVGALQYAIDKIEMLETKINSSAK